MENEIMVLYKSAGYTPDQVIKELAMIVGCAMLADNKSEIKHLSDRMTVNIRADYT